MTFSIERRWGNDSDVASIDEMNKALSELDVIDEEHPDTWLTHESGWTLACHSDGLVQWGNAEDGNESWHINSISRAQMLDLWIKLSQGRIDEIKRLDWVVGNGYKPNTAEENQAIAESILASDKKYYELLIPSDDEKCIETGCSYNAVKRSVLCRFHHFEMIMKKKCPFPP